MPLEKQGSGSLDPEDFNAVVDAVTALQSGGSAMSLLSKTTLSSPGTFDVSGIGQGGNDLYIVLIARTVTVATFDTLELRFNNDSAVNYYNQRIRGNATTASAAEGMAATSFQLANLPGASATAGLFGWVAVTVFGYASTSWSKMYEFRNNAASALSTTNMNAVFGGGIWNNTAAINRVQACGGTGANLVTGSQLRIYSVV